MQASTGILRQARAEAWRVDAVLEPAQAGAGADACAAAPIVAKPAWCIALFVSHRNVLLWFDTLDSVRAFIGEDYEAAHVPARAQTVLTDFDRRSAHYEVLDHREQPQ